MKVAKSIVFISLIFAACFAVIWDTAPYAINPDLLFAKMNGYIDTPPYQIVVDIFKDFISPIFKNLGISFSNFYDNAVNAVSGWYSSLMEILQPLLDKLSALLSFIGSLFGG